MLLLLFLVVVVVVVVVVVRDAERCVSLLSVFDMCDADRCVSLSSVFDVLIIITVFVWQNLDQSNRSALIQQTFACNHAGY